MMGLVRICIDVARAGARKIWGGEISTVWLKWSCLAGRLIIDCVDTRGLAL